MRRIALILGVLVASPLALASSAPTQSPISIRAGQSTHLRLSVRGSHLLVEGRLSRPRSSRCRARRSGGMVCELAGATSIVVETSPEPDKVEVLDPLPVPLIAYLGSGSDKLIGNSEPDVCYPEGTARNRCIGRGGDDVCESAPVNTDCVGGRGDDFCRTGAGSDGCWGGPGDDVCLMGRGHDGCHGGPGNDRLYGGPASDQLYGGPGRDYCDGGPGLGRSHGCERGPGG